ncbi:hypothetical protein WJX72_000085 [[Myrmecia] bisecta]|uniref:Integrase catalytic domain-containing protein n=1 Tax=[Myrmecia] bisecta TaxID=41462 RepID=A0AAW1Q3L1_9CHLO
MSDWIVANYKPHRCLDTLILDVYKEKLDKLTDTRYVEHKERVDYENLLPGGEDGRSLEEIVDLWFRPKRLALRVFDRHGNVTFTYHPAQDKKTLNTRLTPSTLNILQHCSHVWRLNDGGNSIKFKNQLDEDTGEFKSGQCGRGNQHFHLKDPARVQQVTRVLANNEDDLVPFIKELDEESKAEEAASQAAKDDKIEVMWNEDTLRDLLGRLVYGQHYLPEIDCSGGRVSKIKLKIGSYYHPKYINITTHNSGVHQYLPPFASEEEYKCYVEGKSKVADALMTSETLSRYGPGVYDMLTAHMPRPLTCSFEDYEMGTTHPQQDCSKHYLGCAMRLKKIAVLSTADAMDTSMAARQKPLEDWNIYMVRTLAKTTYFPTEHCLRAGRTLKHYDPAQYVILGVLRPSHLVPNDALRGAVKAVYEMPMREKFQKAAGNHPIGMLGRHTNTSGTAEVFTTLLEAASGAVVGDKVASIPTEEGTLFLLHKRETTPLVDGFLPHKLFILDESAHQMEQHQQLMVSYGVVTSAMKTDGVMHEPNEDAVHHMVLKNKDVFVDPQCSAFANIGRFKVVGEPDKLPSKRFEWLRNELVMALTVERDVTVLDIPDFFGETKEERERWIQPYMAAMDQHNYVCLLADFPQAGKSSLCKEYAKRRGRKVLFITPNNALGDKLEVEGYPYRTQHKFHGRDFRGKKVRDTDWSEYDMFVFEEIYQVPIFFLNLINKTIGQDEQADLARLKEELFSGDHKPFEILANWFEETSLAELTKDQIVITLENNTMCYVNNAIMGGNLSPHMATAADIIHAAYTNPETGFRGREALYQVLKGQVTRADIKRYYDSQGATQVFAKAPKVAALPPVTAYSPELLWEADLMDFAKLKTKNKGFAYALVVIDDFTKKVWTVSLKTKTIRDVLAGFRQVFKEAGAKPLRLMTDEEAAITSKTFQDFANKEGVRWNNKNQHAAIVERVVGTFKDNIERFFVSSKTLKWVSVLDAFVRAYNKKKHATTGEAPNDVHGGVVQDVRMRMKEKRVAILSKLVNSKLKAGQSITL